MTDDNHTYLYICDGKACGDVQPLICGSPMCTTRPFPVSIFQTPAICQHTSKKEHAVNSSEDFLPTTFKRIPKSDIFVELIDLENLTMEEFHKNGCIQ